MNPQGIVPVMLPMFVNVDVLRRLLDPDVDILDAMVLNTETEEESERSATLSELREFTTLETELPALEQGALCAICVEPLTSVHRVLPCGHRYHVSCIDHALEMRITCPTCRHDITVPVPPSPTRMPLPELSVSTLSSTSAEGRTLRRRPVRS
jgi:hypothetical protein